MSYAKPAANPAQRRNTIHTKTHTAKQNVDAPNVEKTKLCAPSVAPNAFAWTFAEHAKSYLALHALPSCPNTLLLWRTSRVISNEVTSLSAQTARHVALEQKKDELVVALWKNIDAPDPVNDFSDVRHMPALSSHKYEGTKHTKYSAMTVKLKQSPKNNACENR